MSFDALSSHPQRIAIVGGGISGLAAAYLLAPTHAVTLYEAAPRLGGHARTVVAGKRGDQPVDTGFIVFNYANYPHLTRMFRDLDVPVVKSDMSFGATIDDGRIEYGLRDLPALFAQKRNLLRPGFPRMIRDVLRFNARAEALAKDDDTTIGELMDTLQLGDWFQRYYLTPLCGAIWSTPTEQIRAFPARALVQFFRNHALLSPSGQHQWWTVDGGSVEYVRRLEQHLRGRGVALRPGTPVQSVERQDGLVTIHAKGCAAENFDQVIMACHSDQSLRLLANPTMAETKALSAIRYQDNHMVLHCDEGQMPKRRKVWSSWVYKADTTKEETAIGVSYWMNRLQNIPEDDPLFVTLNPATEIREDLIYDQETFRHPVFDRAALRAQKELTAMQGANNTWFAGAYTRHGFHEDGFASAVRITRMMERETV
ncbi:amine oxidoreductase-like protein [Actibacterium atlanticum]|uniref:Amine oxidoreductase-like protein n=1 Tax=Actibacterium atlanticum TaxID=1461693 RepID=A0A058ZN39_9RHOB|nr:FAD-dependent oxidoreductase [Actibacterium atlanticum]KCV83039.1 amine oxidoreductase-like protein [Actibacterium atlanticum]